MSQPAALITGGASGIGQALATHLVHKGWKVTIADVNAAAGAATVTALGPASASFVRTDVTKFDQQVAMFKHAAAFGGGRLDLFVACAAIADTQDIYDPVPLDARGDPTPLDLTATEIDLVAPIQGTWLFRHYAGRNAVQGGKVVIMSSAGGLYASPMKPQYGLSKHALIGFARSVGPPLLANDNVTVNAICPNMILTPLCPPAVAALLPAEHLTPMATALRAFDMLLADATITGRVFELIKDEVIERVQIPYSNESVRWMMNEGTELAKVGYGDFMKKNKGANGE